MESPLTAFPALNSEQLIGFFLGIFMMFLAVPASKYVFDGPTTPLMYILAVWFAPITLTVAAWKWLNTPRF